MKTMTNVKVESDILIFSDGATPGNTIKMSVVDNKLKVEYVAKAVS